MLVEPARDLAGGDAGRLFGGKSEHARADAAEDDALHVVRERRVKAAAVARLELLAVVGRGTRAFGDLRPHRMNHVARRQVVGRRHLGQAHRLLEALGLHDFGALDAQLHAREGVDLVVDAVVPGNPTAEHFGIGGVDDAVGLHVDDVALPHAQARVAGHGHRAAHGHDAVGFDHRGEQLVLFGQKLRARWVGLAGVHQGAEHGPELFGVFVGFGRGRRHDLPALAEELHDQMGEQLAVLHGGKRLGH